MGNKQKKYRAKAYLVLGTDKSILYQPFWYKGHAFEKYQDGCRVVSCTIVYTTRKIKP